MNLYRLRLFCLVVEHQTFTAVAELLVLTQPSVHLQVRELERELGARLLTRSERRMVPTEAGEEVYRVARRMLADAQQLEATLGDLRAFPANHLIVGASSASPNLLIPALVRFRGSVPSSGSRYGSSMVRASATRSFAERQPATSSNGEAAGQSVSTAAAAGSASRWPVSRGHD